MNPRSIGKKAIDWQRFALGIIAIVLGLLALLAKFGLGFSDNAGTWVTGTFGKVSFVLAMAWLAWPQLMALKDLPGGGVAIASVLVGMVVFIARPKLLLYLVPILIAITVLFIAITWIQRNVFPPE